MAVDMSLGVPDNADQNDKILKQYAAARQGLTYQKQNALNQANQGVSRNEAITGLSGGAALKAHENAQRGVENQYSQAYSGLDTAQNQALAQTEAQRNQQQFASGQAQLGQQFQTGERTGAEQFAGQQSTQSQQAQAALQAQQLAQQQGQFTQAQAQQAEQFGGTLGLQQQQLAQQQGQFTQAQAQQGQQFGQSLGEQTAARLQQGQQFGQNLGETQAARLQQGQQFQQNYNLAGQQFNASKDQFYQQMQYQWGEFSQNQQTNILNAITALKNAGLDNQDSVAKYISSLQAISNSNIPGQVVVPSTSNYSSPTPQSPVPGVNPGQIDFAGGFAPAPVPSQNSPQPNQPIVQTTPKSPSAPAAAPYQPPAPSPNLVSDTVKNYITKNGFPLARGQNPTPGMVLQTQGGIPVFRVNQSGSGVEHYYNGNWLPVNNIG